MCLDDSYSIFSSQCYLTCRCIVCNQIVGCNNILVANSNLTSTIECQSSFSLCNYFISVLCVVCNVNVGCFYVGAIINIECICYLDGFYSLQITIYVQCTCLDKASNPEVAIDGSVTIVVIVEEVLFSVYICAIFYLEVDSTDRTVDVCLGTLTECDILCRSD